MRSLTVLSLLLWACALFYVGIYLFVGGFLLVRLEVNRSSACEDVLLPPTGPPPPHGTRDFCRAEPPRFRRAVLLVVDALRYDFARFDRGNAAPRHHENKMPVFEEAASSRPAHGRLYVFRADAPTTTMQRIKGLTTGSLPTFIDVGNNFASSAVLEDNLVRQLTTNGRKRVVFMGDDIWEQLFPGAFHRSLPFHSLDIRDLDTVDDGILRHLHATLAGDDWDVLIAHFLGVDHCGHSFNAADHPAMGRKLAQMDGVVRRVMEGVRNDTLLVVMGDHGMTDAGSHGGESRKETDAALFLYSPSPLFFPPHDDGPPPSPGEDEPQVVPQTDLVPTLALLLGVPIPYSSVGQVLQPLFPPDHHHHHRSQNGTRVPGGGLGRSEALWINVKQVHRFLETYSGMATDLPASSLSELRVEFSHISAEYLASARSGLPASPELVASMRSYLTSVRETCQATWARFNLLKMAAGLTVLLFACLLCLVLSELSRAALVDESAAPLTRANVAAALSAGFCVAVAQLFARGHVEVAWCLAATALVSELMAFRWAYRATKASTATVNGANALKRAGRPSLQSPFVPPLLVLLLRSASLFSDSYVVAEGRVVTFLILSLALYVPIDLNWDGLLLSPKHNFHQPTRLPPSSSVAIRKESFALLASVGLLAACLYLSLSFHSCWEDMGHSWCRPSPFLTPLSRLQDGGRAKTARCVLAVASLSLWTYLPRRWLLRRRGVLGSSGGAAFAARWILPLVSVCLGLSWAVGAAWAAPEDSFRSVGAEAQVALPRTAFSLLGVGMLLLWLDPLPAVTVAPAKYAPPPLPPPPRYRATIAVGPRTEPRHPVVGPPDHMWRRRSPEDGEGGAETDGRRPPAVAEEEEEEEEAFGPGGSVHSAPLLLFCGLSGAGLLALHPEGMASSFLLLLLEAGAILHAHASSAALRRTTTTRPDPGGGLSGYDDVPWTPVVLWCLAATQFFHATGHLPNFPSIQWDAAFVGSPPPGGAAAGMALPAALVTLNTFSSHVLLAAGAPLLLFWPLGRGSGTRARGEREGEGKGKGLATETFRPRENPRRRRLGSALLRLSARCLFVHGVQLLAAACAAAVLRRNLVVWKVFAPKLVFEASGFLLTSAALLVAVALVTRVDAAAARRGRFQRLLPEESMRSQ